METSPFAEDIVRATYRIHGPAAQIFGAVAYMKWVQPIEVLAKYVSANDFDRCMLSILSCAAYMALADHLTHPVARLGAGIVREIDSICRRREKS